MPTINISNDRRQDMLIGALEGGSNYWYLLGPDAWQQVDTFAPEHKHPDLAYSERMWQAILNGAIIPIRGFESSQDDEGENEGEFLGYISLTSIEKGEQKMADSYSEHLLDIVSYNDDAITADVWLQCAVMGDIIFG